jgi:aspartyl-tRNA(Asn)/glutamyl-tRNA(Gln) amidotransferase subunit A
MIIAVNPLEGISIAEYGRLLRSGETTVLLTIEAYLKRIEQLDCRLGAYEFVAADAALETATALDGLLRAGVDLGPLMGVPVAVKDLLAVAGMPTHAGSKLDVGDIIGPEGPFIRGMKQKGVVVLGKTRTVEFALGAVGTNTVRGTPWNPHDSRTKRITGGSSSGSAVAVAAGLCAFAIGTDTGGSVRLPAALCGIFGLKTTVGLWPVGGVFPLSPTLDSLGLLTATAADASTVFHAIMDLPENKPADIVRLRLGKPSRYFYDGLDPAVASCTQVALTRLEAAGAHMVEIDVPEAAEREQLFPVVLPAELIAVLGRERFEKGRHLMDPVVAARAARGLEVPADQYIRLLNRHRELIGIAEKYMANLDGWITPSADIPPPPVAEFDDLEKALGLAFSITKNSQPANLFGQCGISLPVHHLGSNLPVGLQIVCSPNGERGLLAIARALEDVIGTPERIDLEGFC